MWLRATWHECADELDQISQAFRAAYWRRCTGGKGSPRHTDDDEAEMRQTSMKGIQLLRALATAVRSEQDFNLIPRDQTVVGALRRAGATPSDALEVKKGGGYASVLDRPGYDSLDLREALHKIVHADPRKAIMDSCRSDMKLHQAHNKSLQPTALRRRLSSVIRRQQIRSPFRNHSGT